MNCSRTASPNNIWNNSVFWTSWAHDKILLLGATHKSPQTYIGFSAISLVNMTRKTGCAVLYVSTLTCKLQQTITQCCLSVICRDRRSVTACQIGYRLVRTNVCYNTKISNFVVLETLHIDFSNFHSVLNSSQNNYFFKIRSYLICLQIVMIFRLIIA